MLQKIEDAIDELRQMQLLNARLQEKYDVGSTEWHQCESIDDRIHTVLQLLGD